jgi:hypothetical protein
MARITNFVRGRVERMRLHDEIDATYYAQEHDGRKLLQLNTAGRKTRVIQDKVSQSIQLDEGAARQLFDILRDHFNFR